MCVDSRRPAMNLWQQNYDPAGNIWLSSLIASLPILFFFFALIKLKLKGYVAASWTVAIALAVALLFYKMPVAHALRQFARLIHPFLKAIDINIINSTAVHLRKFHLHSPIFLFYAA